jgi:DNA polymerase-1
VAEARKRLFLIDGYALIYRAFFALITRPLRTAQGENTSAAWGVVNFLLRLKEKYRPDYVAWINDAGDSFRTQMYAEYKSTRAKLDDELQADFDRSVERIDALLSALGVPLVTVAGYEADDVIGTLATHAAGEGLEAVIVSGDKDFYQLISPGISLLNPGRGGPAAVDEHWVDESNAAERLGIPPRQVVDFLALVGDSSDNVPGVKGIGEKGAQKLLAAFGDLDTILAKAETIEQKRPREALLAQGDNARLSRTLVTIQRDVPLPIAVSDLVPRTTDRDTLIKLLTELEFFSLVKKLVGDGQGGGGEGGEGGRVATVAGRAVPRAATASPDAGSPAPPSPSSPSSLPPPTVIINDPSQLPELIARLRAAPLVAIEARASSGSPRRSELVGLSLAVTPGGTWYLPFAHRPQGGELAAPEPVRNLPPLSDPAMKALTDYLADPDALKAGHDLKFSWEVLRGAGVELGGAAWDALVVAFLLDAGKRSYALDQLSLEYLGRTLPAPDEVSGRGRSVIAFAEVDVVRAAEHAAAGTRTVLALAALLQPALQGSPMQRVYDEIERPLTRVLVDMEWAGVSVDLPLFKQLSNELARDLEQLQGQIAVVAGEQLNINSPKQLAQVLFDRHQLPVIKRTKTGPSTDADVLEQLAELGHELPALILAYRELQKLKSTYVDTLPLEVNPVSGRIHTTFNQAGAATGRLSSSNPNLQNIPVRTARGEAIRRGFVPSPGSKLLVADYSQIELRIMAHLSGDPAFIQAFREGGDIHRQTAALTFKVPLAEVSASQRAAAKTINFATIYGQGPFALSRQLGITQDEAKQFIAQYFERFAGVRAFLDRQVQLAREQGYVETLMGRRRYVPEIREKNFNMRSYGERNAQNTPLQGSAADLIKLAMIRIHSGLERERLASRMLLQVHDELVFDVPIGEVATMEGLVKSEMESVMPLAVPLVADVGVGANWLDAKH